MGTLFVESLSSDFGITGTSVSATTITGGTYYGDGSNLIGVSGGFTGGTVTGTTNFTGGLSANTFSATTLFGDGSNLTGISSSGGFTGGTVTGATNFTDGLSANTISATTITGTTLYGDGTNLTGVVPTSRTISTTSPLSGGGDLSANRTISIQDAAADGSTKGAAAFTANDFNSTSGVISIDYTNGQSASSTTKGFLTSSDWTSFNNKANSFVSGATYSNNTFTFNNSTGGSFTVLFNTVTGLTVNGNLTVTGTTSSGTISATTYQNLPLRVPRTINITYPTASENITFFYTENSYTIANVDDVVRGTSPSVTYNINYASTRDSGTPTKVFTADRTVTSTSGSTTSTFANPTIASGNWVWITTSAATTGTTEFTLSIFQ